MNFALLAPRASLLTCVLACACADTTATTHPDASRPPDAIDAAAIDAPPPDAGAMREASVNDLAEPSDTAPPVADADDRPSPHEESPPIDDVAPDVAPDALICGGLARCEGVCSDLQFDLRHCGACGRRCAPTQECVRGECVMAPCIGGLVACGDECFDLNTDAAHCGSCECPCPAGTLCSRGSCVAGCPAGITSCRGPSAGACSGAVSCRDLRFDHDHCGACDRACASGELCVNGACAPPAPSDAGP